jgi:two-component system, response regulator FlrC
VNPHGASGASAMLDEYCARASGGTLFLDEIADTSAEFQSALLRLVGEGARDRSHARSDKANKFRIVASTNRPLQREMAAGRFRPDLYFALNVISIQVAALRERIEDVIPLARHFLALQAAETGRSMTLTPEAETALRSYSWPGNVRELENVIERAMVMSPGERIAPGALGIRIAEPIRPAPSTTHETQAGSPPAAPEPAAQPTPSAAEETPAPASASEAEDAARQAGLPLEGTLQDFLDKAAAIRIGRAIESAGGNRNAAAAALGIDRTTLYRLMRRLGL